MLTLMREESEGDSLVEHGHGEHELGSAPALARRQRTRTAASPELGWWHRRFGEVEEMMEELWARCSGRWCGGGSERARRRSAAMARRSMALLGHGEGERDAEQGE